MTTWISKALVIGAALAVLSGCVSGGADASNGPGLFGGALTGASAPRSLSVMGGAVTIAGPDGYCVDRQSSRPGGRSPFVLLAPCARVGGGDPDMRRAALMTATVTEGAGPSAEGYRRFFSEAAGRAALASDGRGDTVTVERMAQAADGSFRVSVLDRMSGDARSGLVDPRSWRAFFTVNGHLVAVSLRGPQAAPLPEAAADALMDGLVAAIRRASAPAAPPAQG